MATPSDLEIAREAHLKPIAEIADDTGIEAGLL
jgi:formyltetrahydrofolate synthetase